MAQKVDATKRKLKAYKATTKENVKCKRWLVQYLAYGQKHSMSSTPINSHHPIPQAFNASSKIKKPLNVSTPMTKKLLHIKEKLEKHKPSLGSKAMPQVKINH